jgi:hypothetical protein
MSKSKSITLPESRKKDVSRGVAIALAFCFFGLGIAAKGALTPPSFSPGGMSPGMNLPNGMGGGFPGGGPMPGGGGIPGLSGTVTEVTADYYVLETEVGLSVQVPLDSETTVKVGDSRELAIK